MDTSTFKSSILLVQGPTQISVLALRCSFLQYLLKHSRITFPCLVPATWVFFCSVMKRETTYMTLYPPRKQVKIYFYTHTNAKCTSALAWTKSPVESKGCAQRLQIFSPGLLCSDCQNLPITAAACAKWTITHLQPD